MNLFFIFFQGIHASFCQFCADLAAFKALLQNRELEVRLEMHHSVDCTSAERLRGQQLLEEFTKAHIVVKSVSHWSPSIRKWSSEFHHFEEVLNSGHGDCCRQLVSYLLFIMRELERWGYREAERPHFGLLKEQYRHGEGIDDIRDSVYFEEWSREMPDREGVGYVDHTIIVTRKCLSFTL